ncbi:hypothetical protein SSX86_021421 [Deinandra increscens subsp. villosa]|uniref:Phytocyanin domain-containing protein n=1 Tax=Deinandra increscens subsp. villosa TaxID=3103831 RepID=A0AAP0CPQ9_9ASTR
MAGMKSVMMMSMVMMMMMVASTMAQTRHVVGGDALGWTIPSGGAPEYATWASQQTFNVGDSLVFNFTTGNHNVAEVSQAAFGPCTTANTLSIATNGPATVPLTAAGAHYYICTVGTHCQIGQKLAINVTGASTTPAPTAGSPPTTTGEATPPPPPSPSTAARSFTVVVPATFMAVALAFFY